MPIEVDVCGGRHKDVLQSWKESLDTLDTLQCKLVFFVDLVTPMWKSEEWMSRQDGHFKRWKELYDFIERKKTLNKRALKELKLQSLNATYYEMWKEAKKYGDFHYSVKNDNDFMIAKYANENDVFAIISNDSDFSIYNGNWKLWSDVDITQEKARQFDKERLWSLLGLESYKRPLFATLAGNDHTKNNHFLKAFVEELRLTSRIERRYDVERIADYVRDLYFNPNHFAFDMGRVVQEAFGSYSENNLELIEESINSYNINRRLVTNKDRFGKKLFELDHHVYLSYLSLTYPVVGVSMAFYDMGGRRGSDSLSQLIVEWTARKIGVLMQKKHLKNQPQTFNLLAKKNRNRNFKFSSEKVIYPKCKYADAVM